ALGAALAYFYASGGTRRLRLPDAQQGSFLGPAYSNEEILAFLEREKAPYHYLDDEALFPLAAQLLDEQNIVGLLEGRMEYGPRALGHRSILADPRSEQMQSRMNLRIKYRESFRPFAPAVLAERCGDYFEPDGESPYMLFCRNVKNCAPEQADLRAELTDDPDLIRIINRRRSEIPAVTHVDHSARVQTVDERRNPFFYRLLKAFEARTGCGLLINTSFNVRGEPIVCTPEDAYRCFMNTEMDVLILQNYVLYKREQPEEKKRNDRYDLD
ncbi:MAG: hypothetical protein IJ594_10600, partial [Oscillospiraceae bacterium]|nr:hypothetical protein [Oscillospiraceae bacterium]